MLFWKTMKDRKKCWTWDKKTVLITIGGNFSRTLCTNSTFIPIKVDTSTAQCFLNVTRKLLTLKRMRTNKQITLELYKQDRGRAARHKQFDIICFCWCRERSCKRKGPKWTQNVCCISRSKICYQYIQEIQEIIEAVYELYHFYTKVTCGCPLIFQKLHWSLKV